MLHQRMVRRQRLLAQRSLGDAESVMAASDAFVQVLPHENAIPLATRRQSVDLTQDGLERALLFVRYTSRDVGSFCGRQNKALYGEFVITPAMWRPARGGARVQ
jgi:hypothetical protein